MSRQNAPFDFKSFDKGFVTDANPVDFPVGASLEEANFWIKEDGSRFRRLGLQPSLSADTHTPTPEEGLGLSGIWYNVGGISNSHFLYVQSGTFVYFYKFNGTSLNEEVGKIDIGSTGELASAAVLDGELVIVDGGKDIQVLRCDNPSDPQATITVEKLRLEIRDTFGATDKVWRNVTDANKRDQIDLQDPKHIAYRPLPGNDSNVDPSLTANLEAHIYNLRNQTWARPRLPVAADASTPAKAQAAKEDPIKMFITEDQHNRIPSNADSVIQALYPNVEAGINSTNRTVDRYHTTDALANSVPNMQAPQGYFIIDALDRRTSRIDRWRDLLVREEGVIDYEYTIDGSNPIESFNPELPEDESITGAKVVAEYGGRLWYAGFEDSTKSQTRLNSYLLYSQISQSRNAVARCYQAGDPTDKVEPEVLATDGGALAIDGAYNIKRLEVLGTTLLVFAENGVWAISGASGDYFTPTSQRIERLSNKGCISSRSVVVDDHMVMYWSEDGIYSIQYERQGRLVVTSLTRLKIQKYINLIGPDQKKGVHGAYDGQQGQAVWVIPGRTRQDSVEVLRYHVKREAFTRDVFTYNPQYLLKGFVRVPPFAFRSDPTRVVVNDVQVTVGMQNVVLSEPYRESSQFSTIAVGLYDISGKRGFFIGGFTREDFKDWGEDDATASILTGFVTGNDLARRKQVPYLTMHFNQTEQYVNYDTGLPEPASGCQMVSRWDWTTSTIGGKWSNPQQVYRLKRVYFPSSLAQSMDGGNGTVVTRNKLRGRGRAVALSFTTEPEKDCQILGWNFQMDANNAI